MVYPVSAPATYTALTTELVVFLPSPKMRNVTITKIDATPNTSVNVYGDGVLVATLLNTQSISLYTDSRISLQGTGAAQVQILDPTDPIGLDFIAPMLVTDPPNFTRPSVFPSGFKVWCQPYRTPFGEVKFRYWTDIDYKMFRPSGWQAYTTYWVDPVNGLDTNAGTSAALPFKSVWKALNTSSATQAIINAKPGIYGQKVDGTKQGWCDQNVAANKVIQRWGDSGRVVLSNHYTDLSWSAAPGLPGVWMATTGSNGASNVWDAKFPDEFGDYMRYQKCNSPGEVQGIAGAYYISASTAVVAQVYVRTADGRAPDSNIRVMGANRNGRIVTDDIWVYLEYCDFEGGNLVFNAAQTSAVSTGQTIATYDCTAKYSASLGSDNPGFYVRGKGLYLAYRCVASQNSEDGFDMNYVSNAAQDGTGDGRSFIIVESVSRNNGNYINTQTPGGEPLSNGFTSHNSCVGLYINCVAFGNFGFNFHDALGARAWLMSCGAWDSRGSRATDNGDFRISQDNTSAYATAWWYDCYSRRPDGRPSTSLVSYEIKNYSSAYIRRHDFGGLGKTVGATSVVEVPI